MSYVRFGAMITTSVVAMYVVMYLSTYQLDHATFSQSRLYMGLAMGGVMALIMLAFMFNMYLSRAANAGIIVAGIIVLSSAIYPDRSQLLVEDLSFMRGMIPHHSMAIMRSERANLSDPRVQELADQIIEAQREEIEQMKTLIDDITNAS
jgi:hypothetical protein